MVSKLSSPSCQGYGKYPQQNKANFRYEIVSNLPAPKTKIPSKIYFHFNANGETEASKAGRDRR